MPRLGVLTFLLALTLAAAAHAVDRTALPLGDGKVSAAPQRGWVYSCQRANPFGGGAQQAGPWIDEEAKTWDATAKIAVQGTVAWDSEFTRTVSGASLLLAGNGLPSTPTGTYPVAATDPAAAYDRNPNSIAAYALSATLPAKPARAAQPTCAGGTVGISLLGVPILSAFDALLRDAVAREVQDSCGGHPHQGSVYHFHALPACYRDPAGRAQHASLIGYALDGFGIYGYRGTNGEKLDDSDLDACHGHTHRVRFGGRAQRIYHYHATREFPYLVGCFRGTPAAFSG